MGKMRGIIAAISPEGVMGLDGKIPWHYSEDFKRFKEITLGSTIIMGRLTFESMNSKPLPGRRNIVITSNRVEGVEFFSSIEEALETCTNEEVWFIGGAKIYEEALEKYADVIDLTSVPDRISDPKAVRFPAIDATLWEPGKSTPNEHNPALTHQRYVRKKAL